MKDNINFFGISLNPSVFMLELTVHAIVLMSVLVFIAGFVNDNEMLLGIISFAFVVSIILKGRELGKKYPQDSTKVEK